MKNETKLNRDCQVRLTQSVRYSMWITLFCSYDIYTYLCRMKRNRIYLYRSGYVKEDLTEVDPVLIQWFYSESMAMRHAIALVSISQSQGIDVSLADYHIIKARKTINGWKEIEGTEKHLA